VTNFKYLGTIYRTWIHDEVKIRPNSMNASCHSVQNFFYGFLPKSSDNKFIILSFYSLFYMDMKPGSLHTLWVHQDKVLRTVFRHTITGSNRKLEAWNNEKFRSLCLSPHVIRVVKSRRMWWAGHVVFMGKLEVHTELSWKTWKEQIT